MVFHSKDPTGWTVAVVLVLAFLALSAYAFIHYVRHGGSTTIIQHDATATHTPPTATQSP